MDRIIINILLIGYLLIGAVSIALSNIWYGLFHLGLLISSVVLVAYSYCSKCPSCTKTCGHPQIGILRKILPQRDKTKYQITDYLGIAPLIIIGVVIPQYWLWQYKVLFVTFWVLNVIVLFGILTRLCVNCENDLCIMNRNTNKG